MTSYKCPLAICFCRDSCGACFLNSLMYHTLITHTEPLPMIRRHYITKTHAVNLFIFGSKCTCPWKRINYNSLVERKAMSVFLVSFPIVKYSNQHSRNRRINFVQGNTTIKKMRCTVLDLINKKIGTAAVVRTAQFKH